MSRPEVFPLASCLICSFIIGWSIVIGWIIVDFAIFFVAQMPLQQAVSMRLFVTTYEWRFMGAREKLNSVYFGIAAFAAGCLGMITNSIIVFLVSLVVLAGALLHDGTIRPKRRR